MRRVAGGIIILLLGAVMLLQIPEVQTKLLYRVLANLETDNDAAISVGSVGFIPSKGLVIKDFAILDKHPYSLDEYGTGLPPVDTLFSAATINAYFSISSLLRGAPHFRSVVVDDGMLHMAAEPHNSYRTNLRRIFRITSKPPKQKEIFLIRNARLNRFQYKITTYKEKRPEYSGFGLNMADLKLVGDIDAHELRFASGIMYLTVDRAVIDTDCGYELHHVSGSMRVGLGKTILTNVQIQDDWSDIRLRRFSLSYPIGNGLSNFSDKVRLHGEIGGSRISMNSVRYFTGKEKENPTVISIRNRAIIEGWIPDLKIFNLAVSEDKFGSSIDIKHCYLKGLPEIRDLNLDLDIDPIRYKDIALSIKGKGDMGTLNVSGHLASGKSGYADVRLTAHDLVSSTPGTIEGRLSGNNFEIGRLTGIKGLGNISFDATAEAVLYPKDPFIVIDTMRVGSIDLFGHTYRNLCLQGDYSKSDANLMLQCDDEKIEADLNAGMHANTITLYGKIAHADLAAIGLSDKMGGISHISTNLDATITSIKKDSLNGDVQLGRLKLAKGGQSHDLGVISVRARSRSGIDKITMNSQFADLRYEKAGKQIDADLDLHDKYGFLAFMVPGLVMADGTLASLNTDDNGLIYGNLTSPRISYKNYSLKNASIDFRKDNEQISALVGSIFTQIGGARINDTRIKLEGSFKRDDDGGMSLATGEGCSYLRFNDQKWDISQSRIQKDANGLSVKDFKLQNGNQSISADGAYSKTQKDTLLLNISNLELAVLNGILPRDLGLGGILNADAAILSPKATAVSRASLHCDDIRIRDCEAGSIKARASLRDGDIRFALANEKGSLKLLNVAGAIDGKQKSIDAKARFDDFNLALAQPFAMDLFSELSGTVDGGIRIKGRKDSYNLDSDSLRLNNAKLRLALTNVAYTLDGPIEIDRKKISLDHLAMTDEEGGKARFSGGLTLNKKESNPLDISVTMNELQVLNSRSTGKGFYGKAYISGDVGLRGNLQNINIDVNASTAKNSQVHVPLAKTSAKESTTLTWREPVNPYLDDEEDFRPAKKNIKRNINAKVRLQAQPNLEASIEIDKTQGHMLTMNGQGDISLDFKSSPREISLGGDYIITAGRYKFSALQGVLQRDFKIKPGSSILLNGTPKNTIFDITAVYNTKANIAPLISSTSTDAGRRNIECGLAITEKISNPSLNFSIDIPDLDPATQSQIQGALNTDDKVQKQFLAVLLTGSFIPEEQSGVVFSGGNAVYSNISSIMSGQLNNILQQLNIPLDMGLNYQQDYAGKNVFDVAVSTQLFHNRLLVNGSIGNKNNITTSKADVVGDLDIEVKIDKMGRFRVKAFSHSADDYTNFLDNLQRNGAGISFQTEFNTFSQLWHRTFGSKEKRMAFKIQQMKLDRVLKTIKLNDE